MRERKRTSTRSVGPFPRNRWFESLYPSGGYWLVGIVDWPNRAGLPGVARESCVLSTWNGPAPRQVGGDGSPVGGCASSASTGIDARCGGPDVSDARGGRAWRKRLNGLSASTGR